MMWGAYRDLQSNQTPGLLERRGESKMKKYFVGKKSQHLEIVVYCPRCDNDPSSKDIQKDHAEQYVYHGASFVVAVGSWVGELLYHFA